jgi:hypothetical protein
VPFQGCQMVYSQTKNPNLGKFYRALHWKMLMDFMAICNILRKLGYFMTSWYILWPIGTFCVHLVHFFRFWYHVSRKIWQPWAFPTKMRAPIFLRDSVWNKLSGEKTPRFDFSLRLKLNRCRWDAINCISSGYKQSDLVCNSWCTTAWIFRPNLPNGNKSKSTKIWDFWNENIPSGKPSAQWFRIGVLCR